MLHSLGGDTVRVETKVNQRLGEGAEQSFVGAHFDHRVGVIVGRIGN